MIILPSILSWIVYLLLLNYIFVENTLSAQQARLENAVYQFRLTIEVDKIFSALEGSPELAHYLEEEETRGYKIYLINKSLRDYHETLESGAPAIDSIRVYSDNPALVYVKPFWQLEQIPLPDSMLDEFMERKFTGVYWYVEPTVDTGGSYDIPVVYAYRKVYSFDYSRVIGIVEARIEDDVVSSLFSQFASAKKQEGRSFAVYSGDAGGIIYQDTEKGGAAGELQEAGLSESTGIYKSWLSNRYMNTVILPDPKLQFVISGKLTGLESGTGHFSLLLISFFIVFLLLFLILFLIRLSDLSGQILDFASYIQNADQDNLTEYRKKNRQWALPYKELQSLIGAYNSLVRDKSVMMTKMQQMELLNDKARYQALQSQIHPHFIFGTLENIRMLALQNEQEEISDMLFSLSSLIRGAVHMDSSGGTLGEEIRIAGCYLYIQKFRLEDRLEYFFRIEAGLERLRMPAFILQPIIENAIQYGVMETAQPCTLVVSAKSLPSCIEIKVTNNGILITRERLEEVNALLQGTKPLDEFKGRHNGISLYNIKERMSIFCQNKVRMYMTLDGDCTGTVIEMERGCGYVPDSDC